MGMLSGKVVLVTGASSGIGRATALAFAREGCRLAIAARRDDRLAALTPELREAGSSEVAARKLDVRDRQAAEEAVAGFHKDFGRIDILVNNAGQARGLRPVETGDETEWRDMVETNVMGLLWVTRAAIPIMKAQRGGHIISLGSVAGHESYAGGSVYAGTKSAERAIMVALRHELLGENIRVSSVDPGLVETEFSLVRFDGDAERAGNVYRGITPLTGDDVADCIVFAASRPEHVNVDEIIVKPVAQAGSKAVFRKGDEPDR
ncbi:MAG TPA: SDR family NAD(P)-dependent oxidoreductase [Chloroflexota bacterium]|nr:SDR family NAD(P)-dependent oxidoreductase [Chloroflexota bacterium]